MRGRDDTRAERLLAGATHRPHDASPEDVEKLRLKRDGHVADLVEQQRAALGLDEEPRLVRHRAGERTLHVAEQLALEQRLGNGRAVDRHERPPRPRRFVVQRTRDQPLPRPRLAHHQDRRRDVGDPRDLLDQDANRLAAPQNRLVRTPGLERALEQGRLTSQITLLERAAQEEHELVGLERLRQVMERAETDRLHRRVDRAVAGHHDHRTRRIGLARRGEETETVELGHSQIGHEPIEVLFRQHRERLARRGRRDGREASVIEAVDDHLGHRGVVVDDQDPGARVRRLHRARTPGGRGSSDRHASRVGNGARWSAYRGGLRRSRARWRDRGRCRRSRPSS